ncbi:MAG: O-antigen ligase family protein, partial [Nevskiales bacterium]
MRQGSSRLMDGVAAALLAAMLVIPFLHPVHYRPIPSFWHEWWAVMLGIGLFAAVLARPAAWSPLRIPGVAMIPLSMIVLILIQYFVGRIYFPQQGLLFAGMLFWALLLTVTGRRLADSHGLEGMAGIAATALVGGALANALALLVQITGADVSARLVFHQPNALLGANLAQPNHLNDQLWLGLGSLLYLHARGRCRDLAAFAIALALLAASTMTGSRSTLLYAAAFVGVAWLAGRDPDRAVELRTLQRSTWVLTALALLLMALHMAAGHFGLLPASHPPSTFERFFADEGGFGLRLSFWQRTWHIFLHFPWLGAGVGGLPWQDYLSIDELPAS